MHPRNKHHDRYDLNALVKTSPRLKDFIILNRGDETVNFSDEEAVKALNQALLLHHYQLAFWDLPLGQLCPPVPGRADYIHHLADLPGLPKGEWNVLDIGTGASLIYPLIGVQEYKWKFTATDIDESSLQFAETIVKNNHLAGKITLKLQSNPEQVFKGIISPGDQFQVTLCNPPFYASEEEARSENARKTKNLKLHTVKRNFGGSASELWTPGGEKNFIRKMIFESVEFKSQVQWFTSLVSKSEHLQEFERIIKKQGARSLTVPMQQGQKQARFIAWTFT